MKFGESYGKHPKRVQKGSSDLTKEALFLVSFPPRNRPKVSKKGYQIYPKRAILDPFLGVYLGVLFGTPWARHPSFHPRNLPRVPKRGVQKGVQK